MIRVGLDFGTTNSSAAVYDGRRIRLLDLDPVNAAPSIMRSTLFITREGVPFAGREAIDRYTQGNVGRAIDYQWSFIGRTEVTFADVGTVLQALYTLADANAPGRLFQSLKVHLADESFRETDVFGTRYTLEALIAVLLSIIVRRIEAEVGGPVDGLVIGRPVHYATEPRLDDLALERMRQACALAGLPRVEFLPEPTAAALSYASTAGARQHALVFDFGGGTLDITIMRIDGPGRVTVLATDGVPVGGDLLDRRLVMGRVLPHFGAGATLGPRRLPFPATILEHLSEWQSIVELNLPRYRRIIDEALRTGNKKRELRALDTLVRENYGLPLYEEVERAKVRLSSLPSTTIAMHVPGIHFAEPVTRGEFDGLVGPDLRTVAACVDRALASAALRPAEVDIVLRTGGSSRVPCFIQMLAERFGEDRLREMDLFTGVATGLAIAAHEGASRERLAEAGTLSA
jgi:hypothetical chaperone protein